MVLVTISIQWYVIRFKKFDHNHNGIFNAGKHFWNSNFLSFYNNSLAVSYVFSIPIKFQYFPVLCNTFYQHTITWFHVFLHNINYIYLHQVLWFEVTNHNS